MPTRRVFLASSLLLASPLLPRLAGAGHGACPPVILESGAPPAASFMRACELTMQDACCEAATPLAEFGAWLSERMPAAVFGLTGDANHVLYGHVALAHGYTLGYRGVHDDRMECLRHRLHGDPRSIDALCASLEAGLPWPCALARTLPALAASSSLAMAADVAALHEPAAARGYWVSWVLRRR